MRSIILCFAGSCLSAISAAQPLLLVPAEADTGRENEAATVNMPRAGFTIAGRTASSLAKTYRFNIPAQKTANTLLDVAERVGIQVIFSRDLITESMSADIRGDYTISEALALSLKGTGLGYSYISRDMIAVNALSTTAFIDVYSEDVAPSHAEEVVIMGRRRESLLASVAQKRRANTAIDAITAEEIGVLPGKSIAESLVQIPGVAGSKNDNGTITKIAIRGAEDLALATFNNREIASTLPTRAVDFGLFPADIINAVQVHKSQDASLIEGGVSGSINLESIAPLNFKKNTLVMKLEGNYTDAANDAYFSDPLGERLNLTSINPINENLGIVASVTYAKETVTRIGDFSPFAWGALGEGIGTQEDFDGDGIVGEEFISTGGETREEGGEERKLNAFANFQWKIDANNGIRWDFLWSEKESVNEAQNQLYLGHFSQPLSRFSNLQFSGDDLFATTVAVDENHAQATRQQLNIDDRLLMSGITIDLKVGSATLTGDIAYSSARARQQFREATLVLSQSDNEFSFNFYGDAPSVTTLVDTRDPSLWTPTGFFGLAAFQDVIEDEIFSFKQDINIDLGLQSESFSFSALRSGVRYTAREKSNLFPTTNSSGGKSTDPNSLNYGCCVIDASPFNESFIEGTITPNNAPIYNVWSLDKIATRFEGGFDKPAATIKGENDERTNSWIVEEDTLSFYIMFDFVGEFIVPFNGNIGWRGVDTRSESKGWKFFSGQSDPLATFTSVKNDYQESLFSTNLTFELGESQVLRLAYADVFSRPPVNALRSSESIGFNVIESVFEGSGGNPEIGPTTADQSSIAYEIYPNDSSLVAMTLHYSELDSFIGRFDIIENINGRRAEINRVDNGDGGYIRGAELALMHFFEALPVPFDQLGVSANYSYTETNIDPSGDEDFKLIGLSREVANASFWWSGHKLEFRLGWDYRSDYTDLDPFNNFLVVDDAQSFSSKLSYDLSPDLRVNLEVSNLSDETRRKYTDNIEQRSSFIARNGRIFSLGIRWQL